MGWHCITVWECELKPSKREETLDAIAFTLNHIWLHDHSVPKPYEPDEESSGVMMAAEEWNFIVFEKWILCILSYFRKIFCALYRIIEKFLYLCCQNTERYDRRENHIAGAG